MALLSMNAHRLRSVPDHARHHHRHGVGGQRGRAGSGSQEQVLANINSLGTNTLEIFPGKDFGDTRSAKIKTLVLADARALAQQPYIAAVTPTVSTLQHAPPRRDRGQRAGQRRRRALLSGQGHASSPRASFFDADSVRSYAQDAVIDDNTRKALFPDGDRARSARSSWSGACRAVSSASPRQQQSGFGSSANPTVYLPYTTVQARFLGDPSLRSISVRVNDATPTAVAEQAVTRL